MCANIGQQTSVYMSEQLHNPPNYQATSQHPRDSKNLWDTEYKGGTSAPVTNRCIIPEHRISVVAAVGTNT